MTVEADIFNALKGLVTGADGKARVYPDVAPENTERPYITYQQVGGEAINFMDGALPGKRNGRFQINVWADRRPQASTLARQVEDALRSTPALQTTVLGSQISDYEPDTKLYGTRQDVSVWFDS